MARAKQARGCTAARLLSISDGDRPLYNNANNGQHSNYRNSTCAHDSRRQRAPRANKPTHNTSSNRVSTVNIETED